MWRLVLYVCAKAIAHDQCAVADAYAVVPLPQSYLSPILCEVEAKQIEAAGAMVQGGGYVMAKCVQEET